MDYAKIIEWTGEGYENWAWLVFIPIVIFIITAVSNGANLTDGIDGLAAGTSAISVLALGIFAFVSGNLVLSSYLNVMYIPNSGEMTVFIAAFVGALIGFLWYNSYPASVFMGDTGSLDDWWNHCSFSNFGSKRNAVTRIMCHLFCRKFIGYSAGFLFQIH